MKFIPKSEYMKIYDELFKSHLSFCISSWGAIPNSKLQSVFAIQKICIRLYLVLSTHMTMLDSGYYASSGVTSTPAMQGQQITEFTVF